jgi:hypothetical protein
MARQSPIHPSPLIGISSFAEDAAATKVVRAAGRKVQLVDRPFPQPLGHRTAAEVWHRQVRWARLRRASFFAYFLPEAVSGGVLPMIALAVVVPALGVPLVPIVLLFGLLWYTSETLLAAAAGWHVSARHPLICLFVTLCYRCCFSARCKVTASSGAATKCRSSGYDRCGMMARVRPRLAEVAPRARRRLHSLRERMSSTPVML